jgi:RNA polymerase sigma factor (sigma-70 family)
MVVNHIQRAASPITPEDGAQVDAALLARVARGEEDALVTLRVRHEPGLRRFVGARVRDAQRTEEVLADVFIAVWRGAAAYRSEATVRAWLYGIARRRTRDAQRRRGLLVEPPDILLARADAGPGPADALLGLPSAHGLVDEVRALPDGLRDVLTLLFDQRMTYEEVAEVLDLPVGTVRSRLHETRRRLRRGVR